MKSALYLAGLILAFNDQNYFPYDLLNLDQDIFNAASVFSYYAPNYVVPAGYILPCPQPNPPEASSRSSTPTPPSIAPIWSQFLIGWLHFL